MVFFDQLKRNDRELRLLAVVMFVGVCVLIVGLWYIQIVSSRQYEEDQQGQTTRTVRVPAVRGKILDRNGFPLADNRPVFSLDLYLGELSPLFRSNYTRIKRVLPHSTSDLPRLQRLARFQVVSNIAHQVSLWLNQEVVLDEEQFHRHFSSLRALPLTFLRNLTTEQVARFSEKPQTLPGLDLRVESVRVYPYQSTAAHLIGIMKRDDSSVENEDAFFHYRLPDWKGLTGVERRFDPEMRGLAGTKNITVNYLGYQTTNSYRRAPDPGGTVTLTLDLRLQLIAERALRTTEYGDEVRGSIVIMDPRNGDVLAAASAPTYNPHLFLDRISNETYAWLNDPVTRRQVNRATYEHYHPGSIFKMITALAALEAGQLKPAEEIYNPGYWQWRENTRPVKDLARPGMYDFRRAFIRSSNTYFIRQAMRPGVVAKLVEIGRKLHLGERTGLIPGQDVPGNFPTPEDLQAGWGPGDTANLSIGQGAIHVTPLQMAIVTSAVANGGTVYWPRIAAKVEPNDPESMIRPAYYKPGMVRDYLGVSPVNIHLLHEVMMADVHDDQGTGKAARTAGLTIGGKTGTAEVEKRGEIVDKITWFSSFAPVHSPRYVVVVMIESGKSGGGTCAPVAGHIYREILKFEQSLRKVTVAQAN
jgi:penicillin-binding protein 2